MKGYKENIEQITRNNDDFRRVLYTAPHSQLVVMSLKPKEEIGLEIHKDNDQFLRFESGKGKLIISGEEYTVGDGYAVVIPSGAKHNVINTSTTESLKLYTIYSPPHHRDQLVHKTKADAETDDEEFDGKLSE